MVAPHPPPSTQPDPVIFERLTQANRKLFYRLEVIQQPERARACGSGPKSSADRRPVDPPPVVELRIFEGGPTIDSSKDVTFLYNANFFLFATLEHARVTAHCRGQGQANTPPVLTGMPVSGMAYLDRPREAGYFLFPDLSVRHEGRYRLTFNLYEQTKEMEDRDAIIKVEPGENQMPEESFDWRMEIKSNDFTVFSAKKFPGLAESTTLSRTVAEQGCRVRIRRDVRMRRRDGKHGGSGDYENAEGEYRRIRASTKTPEPVRSRSISHESVHRTPCNHQDARRMSGHSGVDYAPPPLSFRGAQPAGSHLSFGSQAPLYPPPPFTAAPNPHPPSVPASPSFGPSHAGYPHQQPYPSPAQSHPHPDRPPTSHYASSVNPSPISEAYPEDYRRCSTSNHRGRPTLRHSIGGDEPIEVDPYLNQQPTPHQQPSSLTLPPLSQLGRLSQLAPMPSKSSPMHPHIAPAPAPAPMAPQLAPVGNKRKLDNYSSYNTILPEYSQKNGSREGPLTYWSDLLDLGPYTRASGYQQRSDERGWLPLHKEPHLKKWCDERAKQYRL